MMKLFYAAATYLVLGLASGLFYREFTKVNDYTADSGFTQLSVVHTHLLTLGVIVLLIALVLEKTFTLSRSSMFTWFFWFYNLGLVIGTGTMVANGVLRVLGEETSKSLTGISGSGHILLTAGLIFLFVAVGSRLHASRAASTGTGGSDAAGTNPAASAASASDLSAAK